MLRPVAKLINSQVTIKDQQTTMSAVTTGSRVKPMPPRPRIKIGDRTGVVGRLQAPLTLELAVTLAGKQRLEEMKPLDGAHQELQTDQTGVNPTQVLLTGPATGAEPCLLSLGNTLHRDGEPVDLEIRG